MVHQENIKKVQTETVKIITETEKIIDSLIDKESTKSNKNNKKTLSIKNLTEHKEMLINEKQKLDNLEYVVAVVGTMKAGKSMTINAIVGQEILPSREFPMTTLPTLITHAPKQEKPILKLKNIEPFNLLVNEIRAKLDNTKTSENNDLKELVKSIKDKNISFSSSYKGQDEIEKFLKQINDLMRIAKDFNIEPPYDKFINVDDLPRIEVEFYHLAKEENSSNAKLTLLDTPGPDEFKHSVSLKKIFETQIQNASAVMLLVDYTKMNSQSDVEVKEQVKEVANMIGKQHLFVLLNKFDQRKRSDNSEEKKEEAKRLISEDVLKGKIDKNNIYPISAKSAFYANFGLRELAKNGKIDTSLKWIDDFGVTLMGEDWEDDIEDIKRIERKCKKTWKKSFFEEPLENIISTIHNDALLLSLKSPLDKLENLLKGYNNAFKTRKNAYQKELSELKNIIESLKQDINEVTEKSTKIRESIEDNISKVEVEIKKNSKQIIQKIEESIVEDLKNNTECKKKEEKNRKNKIHNVDDNSFWKQELWEGGLFDFLNKKDKTNKTNSKEPFKEEKLTYRSKDEAKKVIGQINSLFIEILDTSSKAMEQNINENIVKLSNKIDNDIRDKLGSLLNEIEKKLSEEGDTLEINLPKLSIDFHMNSQDKLLSSIKNDEETYTTKGDGIINGALNWLNSKWGNIEQKREIFVIEKNEIINNISEMLEDIQKSEMNNLNKIFDDTIKQPIEKKLQLLIREIEGYRAEQIEILKEKEKSDKESLEKELQFTKNYQKKITKLDTRVKTSKNILEQHNE